MKVILFGATGMVGQGVLRECLLDPEVDAILSVVRRPFASVGQHEQKLKEVVHADFHDFSAIEKELSGYDACFFSLGVSSFRMTEDKYREVTFGITIAAAHALLKANPSIIFLYVSGAGTDSSGRGKVMWARMKGQTENALLALPFRAAYMIRPAFIQPLDNITSSTPAYRVLYRMLRPLLPGLKVALPSYVTTTRQVGRAMLVVAKRGFGKRIIEARDINIF